MDKVKIDVQGLNEGQHASDEYFTWLCFTSSSCSSYTRHRSVACTNVGCFRAERRVSYRRAYSRKRSLMHIAFTIRSPVANGPLSGAKRPSSEPPVSVWANVNMKQKMSLQCV